MSSQTTMLSPVASSRFRWSRNSSAPAVESNLCIHCGVRPRYVENGVGHPFCGRTCAKSYRGRGKSTPSPRVVQRTCTGCGSQTLTGPERLCSACQYQTDVKGLELREVVDDATLNALIAHFERSWSSAERPQVARAMNVHVSGRDWVRYQAYLEKMKAAGGYRELRTYYGAQCICPFAIKNMQLCEWRSCGICMVIKHSFTMFHFGEMTTRGRLGSGIYTTSDSSSADTEVTSCLASPYRVMVVCDVIVPAQNDSNGIVDGSDIFVTDPDAILPVYVILYQYRKTNASRR